MNDNEIKVSQLNEATELNDNDIFMVVQEGVNKKIKSKKIGGNEVLISDDPTEITNQTKLYIDTDTGTATYKDGEAWIPLKDNEVAISDTEPTSNDNEIWIDTSSNATYINQEVNIGATNPNNTPTWFKMSKNIFIPTLYTNNTKIVVANGSASLNDDEFSFTASGTDLYFGQVATINQPYNNTMGTLYEVIPNETIKFLITNNQFNSLLISKYTKEKVSLGWVNIASTKEIKIPANCYYISVRLGVNPATAGTTYTTKIMMSKTANNLTTYEKYINPSMIINNEKLFNAKKGKIASSWYDTTSQTIATDYTKITGFEINITTTGEDLLVTVALAAYLSSNGTGSLWLYIDGERQTTRICTCISTSTQNYFGQALIKDLPAGNHKLELYGRSDNSAYNLIIPTIYNKTFSAIEL